MSLSSKSTFGLKIYFLTEENIVAEEKILTNKLRSMEWKQIELLMLALDY